MSRLLACVGLAFRILLAVPCEAAMKKSQPDGVITFDVENASTLDAEQRHSPEIEANGVFWRMAVYTYEDDLWVDVQSLYSQTTPWSMDVKTECTLVNEKGSKNVVKEDSDTLTYLYVSSCGLPMMKWDTVIRPEKGFIKDDKITVEIRLWISNLKGIRTIPRVDFTDPSNAFHDVILVVEGEKLYVSKQMLAIHSPVFYAMFYGEFGEKEKKEIELKDVEREPFIELLHVIYPTKKKISDSTAINLLKLADEFQMESVMERAEKILIDGYLPNPEKLRIADEFRLYGLLENSLSEMTTTQDFRDLKNSPIYADLSNETKGILFERHLDACEPASEAEEEATDDEESDD